MMKCFPGGFPGNCHCETPCCHCLKSCIIARFFCNWEAGNQTKSEISLLKYSHFSQLSHYNWHLVWNSKGILTRLFQKSWTFEAWYWVNPPRAERPHDRAAKGRACHMAYMHGKSQRTACWIGSWKSEQQCVAEALKRCTWDQCINGVDPAY